MTVFNQDCTQEFFVGGGGSTGMNNPNMVTGRYNLTPIWSLAPNLIHEKNLY